MITEERQEKPKVSPKTSIDFLTIKYVLRPNMLFKCKYHFHFQTVFCRCIWRDLKCTCRWKRGYWPWNYVCVRNNVPPPWNQTRILWIGCSRPQLWTVVSHGIQCLAQSRLTAKLFLRNHRLLPCLIFIHHGSECISDRCTRYYFSLFWCGLDIIGQGWCVEAMSFY